MGSRVALKVALAAAIAALFAAPAQAGVAGGGYMVPLTYTDTTGQINSVAIEKRNDGFVYIADTAGITLAPGSSCLLQTVTLAQCIPEGDVIVTLSSGNDLFTYSNGAGVFFGEWLTVDGGPGNDGITGGDRNDTLTGGADTDSINGGEGDDAIDGGSEADGLVGGPGNDTISGGMGDDVIFGGTGNDTLNGDHGNDGLYGETGADTLQGGPGDDTYNGGDDNDRLLNLYGRDVFQGGSGFDTVDYTNGQSCLGDGCVPEGVVVSIDGVANDGNWDLDSDGSNFVPADNVQTDVEGVIGTVLADTLNGGTGVLDQTFTGAGGNDTITGGPGTDTIAGAGSGVTPVSLTLTNTALTGSFGTDSFTGIEAASLAGANGNDTIDASAFTGPVTLDGGPAAVSNGADTLIGGSGNDTLNGAVTCCVPDNDALTGGPGNDTFTGSNFRLVESANVNFTLTNTGLTGLGTDTLTGIGSAQLTGGAGNNTLNASAFTRAATLDGGAGIDTLQGGTAADMLTGGPGNDTLDGGGAADRLVETANANFLLVDGTATSAATGNDSLLSVEAATLTGGVGANVLNASGFSGAVILNGAEGADTITGGSAGDTLNGGDGGDTLNGGPGADTLNGDAGADSLNGGADVDALNGGDDNDSLDGGTDIVNDVLHGNGGENRVVGAADTNFTLTPTNLLGHGNDSLFEIQLATLTGGAGDNALNASSFGGAVVLNGGAGADTLLGGSGADTLTGGPGVDTFDAGAGADKVQTHDGVNEASIVCGADADEAFADPGDTVNADCEVLADVLAPNTKLTKGPKAKTISRTAKFVFRSTEPGSKFQCKLDRGAFKACKSPRTYKRLKKGKHTFQVRAIDKAGNVDKTPVKKTWRVR